MFYTVDEVTNVFEEEQRGKKRQRSPSPVENEHGSGVEVALDSQDENVS